MLSPADGIWRPQNDDDDRSYGDSREPRLWIGGHRYALVGRLARGEGSDVFLGRRDEALPARVIVKILRDEGAADLFAREERVLEDLSRATSRGAAHFTRLVPERVAFGRARLGVNGKDGEREVAVRRYRAGFVHTLDDVRRAHGDGLDPAHAVWVWKRVLELLGFVHGAGYVHGAVLAEHLLVDVRDHGVVLAGFSRAVRPGEHLPARTRGRDALYPEAIVRGEPATETTDLVMSARAVLQLLGGDPRRAPARVQAPLAGLLERVATDATGLTAWSLVEQASQAGIEVFGPPRFVPLTMPG